MSTLQALAIWTPTFPELLIVLVIALLLFGKRLPDVARSLGKGVVEFKKGLKGIEDDVDHPPPPPRPASYGEQPPPAPPPS
jgi:sec-independent protein translocase protein TatA